MIRKLFIILSMLLVLIFTTGYRHIGQEVVKKYAEEKTQVCTVAGYAFLWPVSDISAYAGVEGTSTPYIVHVWDNAGHVAIGYLGNVGAGASLGADVLAGWDFTAGWTVSMFTTITDADTLHCTNIGGVTHDAGPLVVGAYYKLVATGTDDMTSVDFHNWTSSYDTSLHRIGQGWDTYYFMADAETFYIRTVGAGDADFTVLTMEPYITPPATALRIVSEKDSNLRGWKHVDTGFKYRNTTHNIQIMRARQ